MAAIVLFSAVAFCQTLARPGWVGSGMSLAPWWLHGVFYEVDPHSFHGLKTEGSGDLQGLTQRLEYVRSLGVDAITLTHFTQQDGATPGRLQAIDPAIGSLEDFDDLVREASRDGIRLVVELDPQAIPEPNALAGVARFWLSRGVGGVYLHSAQAGSVGDASQRAAQFRQVREVAKKFVGQRVVIGDAVPGEAQDVHRGDGPDLTLDPILTGVSQLTAAGFRPLIERLQSGSEGSTAISATDGPGIVRSASRYGDGTNDAAMAKVLAALLLSTRANAQLYFGQEIGLGDKSSAMPWGVAVDPVAEPVPGTVRKVKKPEPPHGPEVAAEEADPNSVLNWYRRLIDIHHGNATLRSGLSTMLNHDDQNVVAWVSRKPNVSLLNPAIVVVCNLSAKPVTLSLADDMRNLHLRGVFFKTILRSDDGMGAMNLNTVSLPAYGVYIGELRY